ncbi:hypothetical protein ALC57_12387 [Trachymyrmex cornetzi]|uniref:Uncharacterized protein n=1 Tax=Trachymyrmex cornetzi TaxID=471704 RepID=A0A195DR42_9HYME|nr:hypothetical protein ALC57_12387 [Trachymyrmex cornetzi]
MNKSTSTVRSFEILRSPHWTAIVRGSPAGRHTAVVRSFRTVRAQRLRRFCRGVAVAAVIVVVVRSTFLAFLAFGSVARI